MKRFRVIILSVLAMMSVGGGLMTAPVMAGSCDGVPTAILDCGGEDGIQHIISLVVEILSIGVGILGVIGITVVGIQYLTAGGNEEQTRKAKRRMFEIILGLVAYVAIYALLKWLLPGFNGDKISFTEESKVLATVILNLI